MRLPKAVALDPRRAGSVWTDDLGRSVKKCGRCGNEMQVNVSRPIPEHCSDCRYFSAYDSTRQDREAVWALYESGLRPFEVAKELDLEATRVARWIRQESRYRADVA